MLSVDSLGGDSILHRLNLRDSEVHLPPARQLKWWKKSQAYNQLSLHVPSILFLKFHFWSTLTLDILKSVLFGVDGFLHSPLENPSVLRCLGFAATHSEVIFAADLESGTFVKMDRSVHQLYAWVFHAWVYGKRLAGMMILCDFLWFYLISVSSNFYLLLYGMDSQGVSQANSSDLDPPIMSSKFETLVSSYFLS